MHGYKYKINISEIILLDDYVGEIKKLILFLNFLHISIEVCFHKLLIFELQLRVVICWLRLVIL